jgi:hypothetical protein
LQRRVEQLVQAGAKSGATGLGVRKPRMTKAEKAKAKKGHCSGCGKLGWTGKKHNTRRGGKVLHCGRYK